MKDKIITSTLINIVNLAFGFILSFVLTPLILRRMGTDQYGIWVFLSIFSANGYFSLLDMGMQGSAVKYVAEYHARGEKDPILARSANVGQFDCSQLSFSVPVDGLFRSRRRIKTL
jgi:O-antigen/teichoic acid export membrane protein